MKGSEGTYANTLLWYIRDCLMFCNIMHTFRYNQFTVCKLENKTKQKNYSLLAIPEKKEKKNPQGKLSVYIAILIKTNS